MLSALWRLARQRDLENRTVVEAWLISGTLDEAATVFSPHSHKRAAAWRVQYGSDLEEYAETRLARLCNLERGELSKRAQARVSQLYFDAYAAAVWTSAHAEYLCATHSETLDVPPTVDRHVPVRLVRV